MLMQWIKLYKVRKSLKKALAASHAEEPGKAIEILNTIFSSSDFTTNFKVRKSTWQTLGHVANKIDEKAIANDTLDKSCCWLISLAF